MTNEPSVKSLIEYLARNLVDTPDEVRVDELPGADGVTYEIRVAPHDTGKVIGRQGRIANALRTVAKASAVHSRERIYVEIAA